VLGADDAWHQGVSVEIKHVDLNESMVRAIARQADRARAARESYAEGELQASEKLLHADALSAAAGVQLRYLQRGNIASDRARPSCPDSDRSPLGDGRHQARGAGEIAMRSTHCNAVVAAATQRRCDMTMVRGHPR
jgi:regulator of protease activity HflC (stomatin/prohibitin superfamily)